MAQPAYDLELFENRAQRPRAKVRAVRGRKKASRLNLQTVKTVAVAVVMACLLYTSDAADDMQCVDLGGRRIIKKNFFKQKTAYEISECLVGSEMCIRDSFLAVIDCGGVGYACRTTNTTLSLSLIHI